MTNDLVAEFFQRDLSDKELSVLRDRLSSEEAALQFSQRAKAFHRKLGAMAVVSLVAKLATTSVKSTGASGATTSLSTGSAIAGKVMLVKAVAVALGAAIVAGSSVVAYKATHSSTISVVTPVRAADAPLVLSAPQIVIRHKAPAPSLPATQRGKQLVLRLTLEEAATVETVVLNPDGVLVKSLGTVEMAAGINRLVWNGRAADGSALAPGRYQIVTRWNGKEMKRWVELQPSPNLYLARSRE